MKKIIILSLLTISTTIKAQFLTLDELLNCVNNNISKTTEVLMNKKWSLKKTDKKMSDDNTLLLKEIIIWNYTNSSGNTLAQLEYYNVIELSTEKSMNFGKYYVDVQYNFTNLEYYNKLNESLKLKKWKVTQDENLGSSNSLDGTIVKSYESEKYNVSIAVTVLKGQQIYFIRIHKKEGVSHD